MSTLVTSTRPTVSVRFVFMAVAGIALVAALVLSVLDLTGGSPASGRGGNVPALYHNACQGALRGPC